MPTCHFNWISIFLDFFVLKCGNVDNVLFPFKEGKMMSCCCIYAFLNTIYLLVFCEWSLNSSTLYHFFTGSIVDIFHAQVCNGDFTLRIQCHYDILLWVVYKQCCNFSCMSWTDSSSSEHYRWKLH